MVATDEIEAPVRILKTLMLIVCCQATARGSCDADFHRFIGSRYLVGVGVELQPSVSTKWNTATAADMFGGIWTELPRAMAWPVTVYHRMIDNPEPVEKNAS